jgi:hypothetical protein
MQRWSRRRWLAWAAGHAGLFGGSGCGTILHPERRGQPAGPLEWGVVALDALGLLLFFVPGVIAFAVDFATGAIYLPPYAYGRVGSADERQQLVRIELPEKRVTLQRVEKVVSEHAAQAVRLTPGAYRTEELQDLDDFWPAANRLASVSTNA